MSWLQQYFGGESPEGEKSQSDVWRQAALKIEKEQEANKVKLNRLFAVVNDAWLLERKYLVGLTEMAIQLALSSMADHPRRDECKSLFYSYVDIGYASCEGE